MKITVALLAIIVGIGNMRPADAQQATFTSSAQVVFVAVSVTSGGQPVAGLTARDFTLTDNNVAQAIELVDIDRMPLDVSVVLGGGNLMDGDQVTRSLGDFNRLSHRLGSADRLRVIHAGELVFEESPMTTAAPRSGTRTMATRGTSFNDALFYALAWPSDAQRRHLVVAFMNGFDTWSALDADRLPALARRSDAVIHVAAFEPPPGRPAVQVRGWTRERDAIASAAVQTGGSLTELADASQTFARILAEFQNSYLLRFSPEGVARAGWHTLTVRVPGRRSLTIRARKGYEGDRRP